jgi:hypothetical protein
MIAVLKAHYALKVIKFVLQIGVLLHLNNDLRSCQKVALELKRFVKIVAKCKQNSILISI